MLKFRMFLIKIIRAIAMFNIILKMNSQCLFGECDLQYCPDICRNTAFFVQSLQVWGMVVLNQENRLLTGSADSELRAWDIEYIEEVKRSCT